jgi:hypothetical protein
MVRVLGWMVLLARSDAAKDAEILVLVLGVKVAASTVWEILHEAGIDPAPERGSATWAGFLRSQAEALCCWPATSSRRSPCLGPGELDHGAVGADLPARATGPHTDGGS